ncbi:peptidoglycan recognition protein family protein [Sporosarcina trichiuri]|uniref:peptidoglycan recognition protein family protein n=1 Tax=Sporosarcina trichiuri TaxID=3056445 RepID=UPI0025B477B4|nr:N-acetylmuramoyl-L-alanine amidase [Sporosarcina sp. 0.2-SM1T-5]WJY27497.1 N-acetylmuramoyl-L-alanine amidase [Sporosarcina sp. 0.2-SM1T-5]
MLTIKNHLVTPSIASRVTSPGRNTCEYITVHETDNTSRGADANAHARLQASGNSRQASWHITVDDKQAIRSFDDSAICWHAGAKAPRVSGNPRSIGIEICVNAGGNYGQAVENAAQVVAQLMQAHNIPIGKVVQHNHWSGKNCPRHLRADDRAVSWGNFKSKVSAYLSGSTSTAATGGAWHIEYGDSGARVLELQKALNTLGYKVAEDSQFGPSLKAALMAWQKAEGLTIDGMYGPTGQKKMAECLAAKKKEETPLSEQKNAAPSKSLAADVARAKELGITDGTYPHRPATREEVAAMIVRAVDKK